MTREEAIAIIKDHMSVHKIYEERAVKITEALNMAIFALKAQSAQLEQRWIPCSERLPEDEYVLISKMLSNISGSKWIVGIAIRTADPRSGKIQWRDSGFGVIQDDKVLAWMPLPAAYEGEGEQDERQT